MGAGFLSSAPVFLRFLTLGQRAAIGVEMLPLLQAEAKARQATAGDRGIEGGRGNKKAETLSTNLPEGFHGKHGKAAEIAAEAVQVGSSSIGRARVVRGEGRRGAAPEG